MRRSSRLWVLALVAGLVVAGALGYWAMGGNGLDPFASGSHSPPDRIKHIIVIAQENHAYDNYFGAYCTSLGPACPTIANGLAPNTCVPYVLENPAAGCAAPMPFSSYQRLPSDLPHGWLWAHETWDSGAMDGVVAANGGNTTPLGYYTASSVSMYWDMAEEYGLGDAFFSGTMTDSLANHWLLVSQTAPSPSYQTETPTSFVNGSDLNSLGKEYLNQANATPTIVDLLQQHGISWKVYSANVPVGGYGEYLGHAINDTGQWVNTVWDQFDPLTSKASTFTSEYAPHCVNRSELLGDAQSGALPSVSYVFPTFPLSEHPPSPLYKGENWVASLVNAIESSPDWNSSAILLTWDDWGGWYDHVDPPNEGTSGSGWGFRVPLLVISPYTHAGMLGGGPASFSSIPKFIETVFGLPSMGPVDGNAPNLMDYFDFSMSPRAPMQFSVNESYPQPFQAGSLVRDGSATAGPGMWVSAPLAGVPSSLGACVWLSPLLLRVGSGRAIPP